MSSCSNSCSTCNKSCSERKAGEPNPFLAPMNEFSSVRHVIGVVSGKGGVGKSLVTTMLACETAKLGFETAILDADITGPSIPKALGIKAKAVTTENDQLLPIASANGVKVMSLNLISPDETDPVVWRGPVIAGTVKQFWTEVVWGDIDYMFVDMPPGTGDVPLTVFQSLPLDGIIVVTSPQELVSMIVAKAVKMAKIMNIPILGIVENFSYLECPDCGKQINVFGESKVETVSKEQGINLFTKIPIKPEIASMVDAGRIYDINAEWLSGMVDRIISL